MSAPSASSAYVRQGAVAAIVHIALNTAASGVDLFELGTGTGVVLKLESIGAVVAYLIPQAVTTVNDIARNTQLREDAD